MLEERVFSHPEVQDALKNFVCVRLDGRESSENAALKQEYGPVVPGNVQNRIVSPTGENLSGLPTHVDVSLLAEFLNYWVALYPGVDLETEALPPLPFFGTLHQALNVSACDARPLGIVVHSSRESKDRLDEIAKPLAWLPEFSGCFHFVHCHPHDEVLDKIAGLTTPVEDGLYLVGPDQFGMKGQVLESLRAGDSPEAVSEAGRRAREAYVANFHQKSLVEKFQLHNELDEERWFYPISN